MAAPPSTSQTNTASPGGNTADNTGDVSTLVDIDPSSRCYRRVQQQNKIEVSVCSKRKQYLEHQRKQIHARITREEEELKFQLQRLQEEKQRPFTEDDLENFDQMSIRAESDSEEEAFVNPYPITFSATKSATPGSMPTDGTNEGLHSRSQVQRGHVESHTLSTASLASTTNHSPTATYLPPLSPTRPLSRHYLSVDDHFLSPHSCSPPPPPISILDSQGSWIGDPEAISSIRRPRKSVAQMKADHIWTRSTSLKEGSNLRRSRSGVSRSKSMREGSLGEIHRGLSRSGVLSRSGSIKENIPRSNESLNESCSERVTPRRLRNMSGQTTGQNGRKVTMKRDSLPGVLMINVEPPPTITSSRNEPLPPISPCNKDSFKSPLNLPTCAPSSTLNSSLGT